MSYLILGLDISTSITGWSVFDAETSEPIQISHVILKDVKSIFKKADRMDATLREIKEKYDIKQVWIESNLTMFRAGRSSANTIALLAKFNGVVSHLCYSLFGKEPNFIQAVSARKTCGIPIQKGKKAKEEVFEFAKRNFLWYVPVYKKTGRPKDFVGDELDSIVIALHGCKLFQKRRATFEPIRVVA